jgi:peptide/nickel transport system permease protein
MLRHALRRLLWTFPTLLGVSIVCFLFLSFVPDPTDGPEAVVLGAAERTRLRRERFLDLPRFVNLSPQDVRVRALEVLQAIATDGPDAEQAREELVRLGGAALPYVLPALDALAPEPRARVALALSPIARRMGIAEGPDADDPARASAFWAGFWDDRGIEFRRASVRSAVRRVARYGSPSRAAELRELDTFALQDVMIALDPPTDAASFQQARLLVDIAAHVTGRPDRIAPGDDLATAAACVDRWRSFWAVYGSDFVPMTGMSRLAATITETRYGKWAFGAVTQRLGRGMGGAPVLDEFMLRAPITLAILFGAIALAYAAGIPLGALAAATRGGKRDLTVACVLFSLYAIPTAVIAILVVRALPAPAAGIIAATVVLALSLVAAPARQARSALAFVLSKDFVRAAMSRGASHTRAVVMHGLRNALLPVATLAALEAPIALGGAFVVERIFGLQGLGEATIRAVAERDTSWLMALSLFAATAAAVGVVVTDLAYALIDPRLAPAVFSRSGRV